jgi:hypothetical protein
MIFLTIFSSLHLEYFKIFWEYFLKCSDKGCIISSSTLNCNQVHNIKFTYSSTMTLEGTLSHIGLVNWQQRLGLLGHVEIGL